QENLVELYSLSDSLMLLSEKESFGLVLVEAMACGVPCIGTNVGGIPEVIDHGKNGFVCEVGDIEGIADATIKLLTDEILHNTFSDLSIRRVQEKFSSEEILNQYEELYYQLIEMEDE